jgi:NADH:ubiquinone oxidoreductase subunit 3 (subunit A)
MNNLILTPVFAFLIYFLVVSAASGLGRLFSARGRKSQFKSEPYASGEDYDPVPAAPGYRQFFVIALFFAVLHLGIIMIGSSDLSSVTGIYLLGLILALVALILG